MKKMSVSEKIEALQNGMNTYKFPVKYFPKSDEIHGKTFAIASNGPHGSLNIHSRYMTYEEFNAYLFGYYDAKSNKF